MSKEALQEIANSDRGWAAERAQIALDMAAQFEAGELDEDEYKELMRDLVNMDELDAEADDLETKTLLVTAVYGVAQIV
jgi:hypothetical protein